ncbi:MAG: calcium/sodium antiporter [Candidatus Riflebacteria bacterium]
MLLNIIFCLIGFVILSYAADKLVEGASNLALDFGISKMVIGMTIVAAGTSLPELVVSVNASLKGNPELSLGNVVGSNIMNIALILGIAALIQPIVCKKQTIRREVPILIGSALLIWYVAYTDKQITLHEGIVILILLVIYTYMSYIWSKEGGDEEEGNPSTEKVSTATNLAFIFGGLIGLVAGSELLVRGAIAIAQSIGVSDEVIGLTLIAIGTSLPELATSVTAARRGQSDIALGNVVGSNIFNVLAIIGCAAVVGPFNGIPGADILKVSDNMLGIHIPLMVVISLAVLPIMSTGLKIVRLEGAFLVCFYLAYNVVLFQTSEVTPPTLQNGSQTVASETIKLPVTVPQPETLTTPATASAIIETPAEPASATNELPAIDSSGTATESAAPVQESTEAKPGEEIEIYPASQPVSPETEKPLQLPTLGTASEAITEN